MRRFELLLVYGEVFAVGWAAIFGVRTRRGIVAGLLLALVILHWQSEGLRWQMIPIYGAAIGLAIGDILAVERRLDWFRRISRGIFGLAGIGLAMVIPLVLPVPEAPVPPGPESIGTVSVELVDQEREEIYGPEPGGPRELMAQIWYPAEEVSDLDPVIWSEDWDVVVPGVADLMGLPGWFFGYTRYVSSNSFPSAPASPGTFPVVIYSHDWTGFRTVALNQIETLVSNGYMVVALDHTYASVATRFEDGAVAELDSAALPADPESVGEAAYVEASRNLVGTLSDDIVTLVNALESGTDGPFGALAESADVTRLGVYGHGAGGGAALSFCLQDERCDAVLGLDPWVQPLPDDVIAASAIKPALYMRSDEERGSVNDAILRGIAERSEAITYWIGVEGAWSSDFTVTPLISPFADRFGLKGPIPAGRIMPIVDRYLTGFFDVYLLETGAAALDTASFPEVSTEVIRPDQ